MTSDFDKLCRTLSEGSNKKKGNRRRGSGKSRHVRGHKQKMRSALSHKPGFYSDKKHGNLGLYVMPSQEGKPTISTNLYPGGNVQDAKKYFIYTTMGKISQKAIDRFSVEDWEEFFDYLQSRGIGPELKFVIYHIAPEDFEDDEAVTKEVQRVAPGSKDITGGAGSMPSRMKKTPTKMGSSLVQVFTRYRVQDEAHELANQISESLYGDEYDNLPPQYRYVVNSDLFPQVREVNQKFADSPNTEQITLTVTIGMPGEDAATMSSRYQTAPIDDDATDAKSHFGAHADFSKDAEKEFDDKNPTARAPAFKMPPADDKHKQAYEREKEQKRKDQEKEDNKGFFQKYFGIGDK